MTNGSLLDTNVVIKAISKDLSAINCLENLKKQKIYTSVITIGELAYGANKSKMKEYNIKIFSDFIDSRRVLKIDEKSAFIYGEVKNGLKSIGINIPENDIWIAAVAISNQLSLITFDNHFDKIKNLDVLIL